MATLNHLEKKSKLVLYEADLKPSEQKERTIYLTPELCEWIEDELDFAAMDWHKTLSPSEQVEEMFDQFVRGYNMGQGEMQKLLPVGHHVWEFRPLDVRIFGYFYRNNVFIAVCGAMKKDLKPSKKYKPYIEKVINFRDGLGANEPKFMKGELYELISIQ